ncbi:MAG TPA: response regulator transcription factor [Gaiellaceae bacterium]|nr:response regulator transcription factor [Gaiellaceae bacterium]
MEGTSQPTTCVVADDHPAIRAAVTDMLAREGFAVVAAVSDGGEALAAIDRHHPDVALLDLRMPTLTGIDVARRARRSSPSTAVVLYTAYAEQAHLADSLDAGARAYVLKEAPLPDLLRAIRTVLGGGTYVDPVLAGSLASAAASTPAPQLTQRERDVLRLLADGKSNEDVAKALYLSPETVRTHLRKAMRKLDADTRTQAVATAIRQSLIA